jgi:DNA-binding NarL/FixJ family response regulator
MPNVKILLGDIGTAWTRVVRELVGENDQLHIVGQAEEAIDILVQVKRADADVVVLSQVLYGGEPGICSHLLLEYPNLVVVLVPSDSGPNVVCRIVLHREVREASREALRIMLRKLDAG